MEKKKLTKKFVAGIKEYIKDNPGIWRHKEIKKVLAEVQDKKKTPPRKTPSVLLNCTIKVNKDSVSVKSKSIPSDAVISFEIKIEPEQWDKFMIFWNLDQKMFIEQVKHNLAQNIIDKICERAETRKPPGINRSKHDLIQWLKGEAEYLYVLFSILCNMPFNETPLWFQNLVKKYVSHKNYFERNGKIDPELFVALCLLEVYSPEMKQHRLAKFFNIKASGFNPKNLRRTYIFNKPDDKGKRLNNNAEAIKKSIEVKLTQATLKGNAKYLRKKGIKYPLSYTDQLAVSDKTKPCNSKGNYIKTQPCLKKSESLLNAIFNIFQDSQMKRLQLKSVTNITLQSLIQP